MDDPDEALLNVFTPLGLKILRQNEAHIPESEAPRRPRVPGRAAACDLDDLASDLAMLIDCGLVAVTGSYPELRYCLTPEGMRAASRTDEHEAAVRAEARELARRRHAASQEATIIPLFSSNQGA